MDERKKVGVVVDAGHGGDDPGALGNGLREKDLTLQAAQYMYKRLKTKGVLIEFGFISNSKDRNNLKSEEYRHELSEVISKSIIQYFT